MIQHVKPEEERLYRHCGSKAVYLFSKCGLKTYLCRKHAHTLLDDLVPLEVSVIKLIGSTVNKICLTLEEV